MAWHISTTATEVTTVIRSLIPTLGDRPSRSSRRSISLETAQPAHQKPTKVPATTKASVSTKGGLCVGTMRKYTRLPVPATGKSRGKITATQMDSATMPTIHATHFIVSNLETPSLLMTSPVEGLAGLEAGTMLDSR